MAKKEATSIENSAGGLDLIVERDAGNEVRILTGNQKNSLAFWKHLSELCEGAIFALEDEEKEMPPPAKPGEILKSFYVCGVSFRTIEEYVAIKKVQEGFSVQEHLDELKPLNIDYRTPDSEVIKLWETVEPITLLRAKILYRSEPHKIELIKLLLNKDIKWDPKEKESTGVENFSYHNY